MAPRIIGNDRLIDGEKLDNITVTAPVDLDDIATSAQVALKADKTYVDAQDASIISTVSGKVDKTTTVNGKALSSNVTLTTDDITEGSTNKYDQVVSILAGAGIQVTGTYPNFTVTNSSPDQIISLTAGANVTITGTYPNFTIASSGGSGTPASSVTDETTYGVVPAVGTSTNYAREDHTHGTPSTPTKNTVGLGNVDNTSDANKPISSATQTALNAKQDTLVSGTNIKTINNQDITGSGNLDITVGSGGYAANVYLTNLTSSVVPAYKQTSYTPDASETILSGVANNNEVLVGTYIFDLPLGLTTVPAGTWNFNLTGYVSSASLTSFIRIETYKRTAGGTETTLFSVTSNSIENTTRELLTFSSTQPSFSVNTTDYIGTRIYVSTTRLVNTTISIVVGDGDASYFTTPLPTRASQIRNVPAGTIISTDVQGAINELDSEKAPIASPTFTGTVGGISEAMISFTDVITNNSSSTKHGYLPKLDNTGTKYLRDDGTWQTISSGGSFWTAMPGTPTRVSNTSFTVTGDITAYVAKGMIIKWTESSTVRMAMVSIPSTYGAPNTTITIIGDTMASIDVSSLKYMAQDPYIANFAVAGSISAIGTDVCNVFYANEPYRVLGAELSVGKVASTSGNTVVDININGTTAFTAKPTIAYNALTTATPFTADTGTSLSLNNRVSIDIDTVTVTTFPEDMYIKLYLVPTRYANLA